MAEKPLLRLDPVLRLRVCRQITGRYVSVTQWCNGRKDITNNHVGRVLGCAPGPRSASADVLVLDSGTLPGKGYLTVISLAEVAYIEVDGQVITGNGVKGGPMSD